MDNLQNIMLFLCRISSECTRIKETWTGVLGKSTVNELDGDGVMDSIICRIVDKCTNFCNVISKECGLQVPTAVPADPVELRMFHTAEFLEGEIIDDKGNICDTEAFYCDEYKVHKMLSRTLLEGSDNIIACAQDIIRYYQAGADNWSEHLSERILNMVQPILDDISELSEVLGQIADWHAGEADRNINMFMIG